MEKNSKRVYSTNPHTRIEQETQAEIPDKPLSGQTVKIRIDSKGRKGKSVTIIEGLQVNPTHLNDIARQLKQLLGTGGTAKQGVIEIQGDRREQIITHLEKLGVKCKKVGG